MADSPPPFYLMLLSIAILPSCAPRWRESNLNKLPITGLLTALTTAYILAAGCGSTLVHQMMLDYTPFYPTIGTLCRHL